MSTAINANKEQGQMTDDFDDRGIKRTAYSTPLQVMDLRSGDIYEAKTLTIRVD